MVGLQAYADALVIFLAIRVVGVPPERVSADLVDVAYERHPWQRPGYGEAAIA